MMALSIDELDSLMELETSFYDDGYRAGIEDGTQAGLVEGKVFGIEKGYEKALEIGRLRGRAIVWASRLFEPAQTTSTTRENSDKEHDMSEVAANLPCFQNQVRLRKQIEALIQFVDSESLPVTNADEAVNLFDGVTIKARNKAKVIANITGEALSTPAADQSHTGIEDAKGLSARH